MTATGILRELFGCQWGRDVATDDDPEPCGERAVAIVVLHHGDTEAGFKLCPRHRDRVIAETTPHDERQSDAEYDERDGHA